MFKRRKAGGAWVAQLVSGVLASSPLSGSLLVLSTSALSLIISVAVSLSPLNK